MVTSNVQVLARVRPALPHEYQFDQAVEVLSTTKIRLSSCKQSYESSYDRVLPESSSQELVYAQVKDCVPSLLSGYNNTILAYGQTGTGKTYTMIGDQSITLSQACSIPCSATGHGIMPRAMWDLFVELDKQRAAEPQHEVKLVVSYLEIYNDRLYDLLQPYKKGSSRDPGRLAFGKTSLEVREDPIAGTHVPNLLYVDVTSCKQVLQLVAAGNCNRATAHTYMNRHSSRSHAKLQLWLEQRPPPTEATAANSSSSGGRTAGTVVVRSKLNFVDLAGSERWGRAHTESEGKTLISELTSINNSLSALALVVSALTDKTAKHVPYRSSRLTHLLQDSLGGNCNTSLLVTLAPCVDAFEDSLAALKFADRARNIANRAVVNSTNDTESILAVKEREILRLRALLASYTSSNGGNAAAGPAGPACGELGQWQQWVADSDDAAGNAGQQEALLLPPTHPSTPLNTTAAAAVSNSSFSRALLMASSNPVTNMPAPATAGAAARGGGRQPLYNTVGKNGTTSAAGDSHAATAATAATAAAEWAALEAELAATRAALALERSMRSALEGQLQEVSAAAHAQHQQPAQHGVTAADDAPAARSSSSLDGTVRERNNAAVSVPASATGSKRRSSGSAAIPKSSSASSSSARNSTALMPQRYAGGSSTVQTDCMPVSVTVREAVGSRGSIASSFTMAAWPAGNDGTSRSASCSYSAAAAAAGAAVSAAVRAAGGQGLQHATGQSKVVQKQHHQQQQQQQHKWRQEGRHHGVQMESKRNDCYPQQQQQQQRQKKEAEGKQQSAAKTVPQWAENWQAMAAQEQRKTDRGKLNISSSTTSSSSSPVNAPAGSQVSKNPLRSSWSPGAAYAVSASGPPGAFWKGRWQKGAVTAAAGAAPGKRSKAAARGDGLSAAGFYTAREFGHAAAEASCGSEQANQRAVSDIGCDSQTAAEAVLHPPQLSSSPKLARTPPSHATSSMIQHTVGQPAVTPPSRGRSSLVLKAPGGGAAALLAANLKPIQLLSNSSPPGSLQALAASAVAAAAAPALGHGGKGHWAGVTREAGVAARGQKDGTHGKKLAKHMPSLSSKQQELGQQVHAAAPHVWSAAKGSYAGGSTNDESCTDAGSAESAVVGAGSVSPPAGWGRSWLLQQARQQQQQQQQQQSAGQPTEPTLPAAGPDAATLAAAVQPQLQPTKGVSSHSEQEEKQPAATGDQLTLGNVSNGTFAEPISSRCSSSGRSTLLLPALSDMALAAPVAVVPCDDSAAAEPGVKPERCSSSDSNMVPLATTAASQADAVQQQQGQELPDEQLFLKEQEAEEYDDDNDDIAGLGGLGCGADLDADASGQALAAACTSDDGQPLAPHPLSLSTAEQQQQQQEQVEEEVVVAEQDANYDDEDDYANVFGGRQASGSDMADTGVGNTHQLPGSGNRAAAVAALL